MSTVKTYYDGSAFVPIEPVHVRKGNLVILSILPEETANLRASERLAEFRRLTSEILELNEIEPLPPGYDEIMGARASFTKELDL